MGREIKLWEMALAALFCLAYCVFMGRALYEVTWLPMSENWQQCHRITLCNPQH